MTDEQEWVVVPPSNPRRILFSGTEQNARDYIEQNFPWSHGDGQEGEIFSAHLVSAPGADPVTFTRGNGWSDATDDSASIREAVAHYQAQRDAGAYEAPAETDESDVVPVEIVPTEDEVA